MAPTAVLLLCIVVCCCCCCCSCVRPKRTTVIVDNLPGIFAPLTAENASRLAMHDTQPWVLLFHNGSVVADFHQQAAQQAAQLRGLLRFGLVNVSGTTATDALKFNFDTGAFRALPFGGADEKRRAFLDTATFDEAIHHASASVPDDIVRVDSEEQLKSLLSDAVSSDPSRFTVLFTIRDATPTLLQRVLSKKLSSTFNFGLVPRAAEATTKERIGIDLSVPGLAVLMVRADGSVEAVRLSDSGIVEDDVSYKEALRFLVEFNREFRPQLAGRRREDNATVLLMLDVLRDERQQFDIIDFNEAADAAGGRRADEL